jgi:hypothetical protein
MAVRSNETSARPAYIFDRELEADVRANTAGAYNESLARSNAKNLQIYRRIIKWFFKWDAGRGSQRDRNRLKQWLNVSPRWEGSWADEQSCREDFAAALKESMQEDPTNPDRNSDNKKYAQKDYDQFLENQFVRGEFWKAGARTEPDAEDVRRVMRAVKGLEDDEAKDVDETDN